MDQHQSTPPAYGTDEYRKPPPYFAQPGPTETTVNIGSGPQVTGPGFYPPPPQVVHAQAQQGGVRPTVVTVTTAPVYAPANQQVLILGNCPSCRVGFLRSEFDICGIILAILFFPIGILCCLCMMEKRCSHCGARF